MAIVETYILTQEKDGVNCICEFTDEAYVVNTHEEGQELLNKIAEEQIYPMLKRQYLRNLEKQKQMNAKK